MQKTTIYLADLAHTHSVRDDSIPVPLGIGYVAAYTDAVFGADVDIRLFKHPERLLSAAARKPPDVLGFAHYGWSTNLNLAVGRYLRKQNPDLLMVAGGPDIDRDDASVLRHLRKHDYLDFFVMEGGEEPFAELVEWWRAADRDRIPTAQNLAWRDGNQLGRTSERKLSKIIDNLQSPYLGGYLDEFIDAGMLPLFETNRGCPFRCTFCAWGMASKNLVRRLDLDTILEEIRYVGRRSKSQNWCVCDANFGILERDVEIARAIRAVRNEFGLPRKCHVWLAKNVTKRNLEVAEILGDMVFPVMAVQSLDEQVLTNIKRENISIETYTVYQQRFHEIGSTTYSDVIVPLPGETIDTHLDGLRQLFDLDVDIIQNHNCRLLAGAEINSRESRKKWQMRTRYRLIHGDAGSYRTPDGTLLNCFEYEESLRETSTISEEQMFLLRRLHFLVDFCWNLGTYRPLLRLLRDRGVSPLDIFVKIAEWPRHDGRLAEFWKSFESQSRAEWFDTEDDIVEHYADARRFDGLLRQDDDKLNILFGVIALRDYKNEFNSAILEHAAKCDGVLKRELDEVAEITFALFPPLDNDPQPSVFACGARAARYLGLRKWQPEDRAVRIEGGSGRLFVQGVLSSTEGNSVSKIFNTHGFGLGDLRMAIAPASQ